MSLYRLTHTSPHDAPRTSLDLLTHGDKASLYGQYQSFILNAELELAESTAKDYRYKLLYFIQFCQSRGIQEPSAVTDDDVKAYLFHLKQTVKPKTQNGYCKTVRRFFNWLVEEKRLRDSPMTRVKTPKAPEVIIRIFNADHLQKILQLCGDGTRTGIRNKAMVLTLLDTGIRRKELTGMQVKDIDIRTGDVIVMGKGSVERVVRVSKPTLRAIKDYYESRPGNNPQLWLTEEGKPLAIEGVSAIFKVLKKRAGFSDVRLSAHTFRHTNGTMEMINGASEREVQLQLGHKTSAMTRHYTATYTSMNVLNKHKDFSPVTRLNLK